MRPAPPLHPCPSANLHRHSQEQVKGGAGAGGQALRAGAGLTRDGQALLATAVTRMHLSVRGVSRVLRVSRTIADLAGDTQVSRRHVAEALQYRVRERTPSLES